MIHQFIFAGPKPGLSAEAFQSYWVNLHAVDYAAKIPQIRQYLVATRLPLQAPRAAPFFEGIAEIWLKDDAEQLASMQSPEFLQGARLDEPRWAAFWQTFVLDTESLILADLPGPEPVPEFAKLYVLLKRRPALSLESFREQLIRDRAGMGARTGLARHGVGFARPGLYGFGEPRFDAIEVVSFIDSDSVRAALADRAFADGLISRPYADDRYAFTFVGQEHWVIRPGER